MRPQPPTPPGPPRPTVPDRIRKLLEADAANAENSPNLMVNFDPWALQAFDDTSKLFSLLISKLTNSKTENALDESIKKKGQAAGLSVDDLLAKFTAGDVLPEAAAEWAKLGTFRVFKLITLACQRYWAWGASDLFRLRISSAIGYLRLEAECVGLIKLFEHDDALGDRWLYVRTEKEGKKFFNDTQRELKAKLKDFDLSTAYNIASRTAQHVTMSAISRSLVVEKGYALPDQEFDPEDSYTYHLAVAHYHRIQGRILVALASVLPDVIDEEWKLAIADFAKNSDAMWGTLQKRYADRIGDDAVEEE